MKSPELESSLDEAVQAVTGAARRLHLDVRRETQPVVDAPSALEALGRMDRALAALEADRAADRATSAGVSSKAALNGDDHAADHLLRLDVLTARADLLTLELARQRSMMPLVVAGLARLRSATTINDLVESIPIETAELGYERVMFSWVDNEHWVPRSMHTLSGPQEAQAILEAGSPPYIHVRDLMEVDVVRRRRPILVLDAETNPRVHPTITPVSRSRTFVAAPIVTRNHVQAFVHLDRNVETSLNDEFDRDLLAYFCESIGPLFDRLLASDKAVAEALPNEPITGWTEILTPREEEVLRLAATGLTNAQIGKRLFISSETTKSHLKTLMRKLGARNRGEASALYHQIRSSGQAPDEFLTQLSRQNSDEAAVTSPR